MKLSICIATIESRKTKFDFLVQYLNIIKTDDVEIVSLCDNKQMSIGLKRQKLLEMSTGEYICFIDDDDMVPVNYVQKIIEGINKKVDCVGFLVRLSGWGPVDIMCSLSNQWDGWYDNVGGFKYVRCPNHLSVIKREHCLKIGYKDLRGAEDSDFSLRLKASGLCKTEHFINEELYHYRYQHEPNKYTI